MSRHSLLLCLLLCACETATSGTDSGVTGGTDSGDGADAGADGGGGAPDTGGEVATHDCAEADFVDLTGGARDDRMIMVPRGTYTFDNPCITIRAGQAVMFMWDFSMHPLMAGVAPGHPGTSDVPTPIVPQTTGVLYEPTFPDAGSYAFYCGNHFHSGMYGVVRVVP